MAVMANKYAAYKCVDEALRLDSNHLSEVAFIQYLKSVSAIVEVLIHDAEKKVFPSKTNIQNRKLLKVAKQCLDRTEELGEMLGTDNTFNLPNQSGQSKSENETNELNFNLYPDIRSPNTYMQQSDIMDISVATFDSMPFSNIDICMDRPRTIIRPLDKVQHDNELLLRAYKARLARTQTVGDQMNLQLTLQRRLAENVELAKAKEKVLVHRKQEMQKRLLEQAARKIGSIHSISSKEEEIAKQLYASILQYENEVEWPQTVKKKLKSNPHDFNHIDETVKQTLSAPNHPLYHLLQSLQYTIYDKVIHLISRCPYTIYDFSTEDENHNSNHNSNEKILGRVKQLFRTRSESITSGILPDLNEEFLNEMPPLGDEEPCVFGENLQKKERKLVRSTSQVDIEGLEENALQRHMHYIVVDVRYAMDKLLNMMVLTYDCLDTPEGRDQCYASMEEPFFKSLWPYLLRLFRLAYKSEETAIGKLMRKNCKTTLQELKVCEKYIDGVDEPYADAINEMKSIVNLYCPLKKLDVLVHVAHLVCKDSSISSSMKSIGADDLIPIFCYIALQTQTPQLVTECHGMEQFIHDGYLLGEEGYCLTTMQTVFQYLNSLPK